MKLSEFLSQIKFVDADDDDMDVVISINGKFVDVDYVERRLGLRTEPIIIVPKSCAATRRVPE